MGITSITMECLKKELKKLNFTFDREEDGKIVFQNNMMTFLFYNPKERKVHVVHIMVIHDTILAIVNAALKFFRTGLSVAKKQGSGVLIEYIQVSFSEPGERETEYMRVTTLNEIGPVSAWINSPAPCGFLQSLETKTAWEIRKNILTYGENSEYFLSLTDNMASLLHSEQRAKEAIAFFKIVAQEPLDLRGMRHNSFNWPHYFDIYEAKHRGMTRVMIGEFSFLFKPVFQAGAVFSDTDIYFLDRATVKSNWEKMTSRTIVEEEDEMRWGLKQGEPLLFLPGVNIGPEWRDDVLRAFISKMDREDSILANKALIVRDWIWRLRLRSRIFSAGDIFVSTMIQEFLPLFPDAFINTLA